MKIGQSHSAATRQKLSSLAKGRPWTASQRAARQASPPVPWNKGKKLGPLSEETRQRLSEVHRRSPKPFTMERRKKISESLKGRHIGGISFGEHRVRARLQLAGAEVCRGGWPDFIVRDIDGKIRAIEVKRPRGRLSKLQERVHAMLATVGLVVEVIHESNARSL